jgi:hypothetical protein
MKVEESDLGVGTPVQVHNRFLAEFRPGFEIAEVTGEGYVLKRVSDGERLPASFGPDEIRVDTAAGH